MEMFSANQTVGEIVSILPKASEVFKQYKIDFCYGGNRKLIEVIKEQELDENEVLKKLDEAYRKFENDKSDVKDFREMSPTQLIDHIEQTHHAYVKRALPEISELTTKILRVHGVKHNELFKIHKLFHIIKADLEQHLVKEEEVLFPLIKEYDVNPSGEVYSEIMELIKETEDEHADVGNILKELREISEDYKIPDDVCSTYCAAFNKLEELEADLFQHIHLENNILLTNSRLKFNS